MQYKPNKDFPKLGWIAIVNMAKEIIDVLHGTSVECKDNWMVEGVWDGPFEDGNFHKSEYLFGSGCRIEGGNVYFATNSLPFDRLMFCQYNSNYVFSNSLILLLAYTGARLDSNHDYQAESLSICKGVEAYDKKYTILHPEIDHFYQVYVENTIISKNGLSFQRRDKKHSIKSYNQYYNSITRTLKRIKHNYESNHRKIRISAFSTISTGYDSVAVSSLVKELGVNKLFTGNQLNAAFQFIKMNNEKKQATSIANKLGYEVISIDSRRSQISEDELYFLSTNYPKYYTNAWSEVGLHSMTKYIERKCSAAVVFNGHHGDSVWNTGINEKFLNRNLMRPRAMGFCSEMRLKAGFIAISVPGILWAEIRDIANISNSLSMEPWRLNNDYDRPIPRRIAETAGVERHQFGMKKSYIALDSYMWPINTVLRKQFFRHINETLGVSKTTIYLEYILKKIYRKLSSYSLFSKFPLFKRKENFILSQHIDLYFLMCHWAINILSKRTSSFFPKKGSKNSFE